MRFTYLLASCYCVTFLGCAAQPVFVPLPPTHPASPWACESPVPAQSTTLTINRGDMVPPHPDWQIPGMRDDEIHGHAAGSPSSMDMMGHGHMDMKGSHAKHAPGMVKMEAPAGTVDYVPEGAHDPMGTEPDEHEPELHIDHADPERAKTRKPSAPVAPPMKHGAHSGHSMEGSEDKAAPQKEKKPAEASPEGMKHTIQHRVTPADTPVPPSHDQMDHSQHG